MTINRRHLNSRIVYDIETAAGPTADDYWSAKKIKAPSNWKDEEKIKAHEAEKRLELRDRSGLYPWTAVVTTICAMDNDGLHKFYGNDEKKILSDFGDYLTALENRWGRVQLIGKNSKNFDQPFLVARYMAHDLGVPHTLRPTNEPRDIDECLGYGSQSIKGSLSDYAHLLGIKGKTSTGSNAQAMYDATAFEPEKWEELVTYCAQDVMITNEFLTRYMKQFSASPSHKSTDDYQLTNLSPAEIPF
jgi:predicted PolB exonuclease-like 3'-5' exonuclease